MCIIMYNYRFSCSLLFHAETCSKTTKDEGCEGSFPQLPVPPRYVPHFLFIQSVHASLPGHHYSTQESAAIVLHLHTSHCFYCQLLVTHVLL